MKTAIKDIERTEEVQAIIERMPTKFGLWVTSFILFLLSSTIFIGWKIRYPDTITGEIIINADDAPVKLFANSSGKIYLGKTVSRSSVIENERLAVIQNPTSTEQVDSISALLAKTVQNEAINFGILRGFPRNVTLGELTVKYFYFLNAFNELDNFVTTNSYDVQDKLLRNTLDEHRKLLYIYLERMRLGNENIHLMKKFVKRDSILYAEKVLEEAANDHTKMSFLVTQDSYQEILKDINITKEEISKINGTLQQNALEKFEKGKQFRLNFFSSYTDLINCIKQWEQKFVIKAPIKGQVQFLKFWMNNQFIDGGEAIFTIVPERKNIIGQMHLPAAGAGKVKLGQRVIIKLENYPYTEYGYVEGKVSAISLTTNPIKSPVGDIETYLVNITLPQGLKTNYGSYLDFKFEIKGIGEIVTKDRKLWQRLFDNLTYTLHKK